MFSFSYFISLLFTQVIELAITYLLIKKKFLLIILLLINLITHPLVNYLFWVNQFLSFFIVNWFNVFIFELLIIIVEWLLLKFVVKVKSVELLKLSLIINLSSFFFGLVCL
jgi:hypothetical protein